jgi:ferredoxin
MTARTVTIRWPGGHSSCVESGSPWLLAARQAGLTIPTGCLGGSCGACEIEVNGRIVRACIATVPPSRSGELSVTLACDPTW